ncbi:hypothetical protein GMSM_27240 [Geomonas sp. Red276]
MPARFTPLALAAMLLLPLPAGATLGGPPSSVAADRTALSATHRAAISRNGYTINEMADRATVVREYLSADGVVFAIAWEGNLHPDLSQLLGGYAGEYSAARQKAPRVAGRRRQRLVTGSMVVETWGHMRGLRGRAYLPARLPSGVSVHEIR